MAGALDVVGDRGRANLVGAWLEGAESGARCCGSLCLISGEKDRANSSPACPGPRAMLAPPTQLISGSGSPIHKQRPATPAQEA